MKALFSFPNPVNETSARTVAAAVAVLAVVAVAFQQGWLLPVLAYGFVARALTGPAPGVRVFAVRDADGNRLSIESRELVRDQG